MGFGPDNNGGSLVERQCCVFEVPKDARLEFTFSADAWFENAMCFYLNRGSDKIAERGNYNRSLSPWSFRGDPHHVQYLTLTCWTKSSPPDPGKSWGPAKVVLRVDQPHKKLIGLEDSGDNDGNDLEAWLKVTSGQIKLVPFDTVWPK